MSTYNEEAHAFLKSKMVEYRISYKDLSKLMTNSSSDEDIERTAMLLSRKIRRGAFSFAFALEVLEKLNVKIKAERLNG